MSYANRRVLVAGGTGTIGIPLTHRLIAQGAKVTVVSLSAADYAHSLFADKVDYIKADLTDINACQQVCKEQDDVFNLVCLKGSTGMQDKKIASYFVTMLRYQTNLMEAALQNKVERFMFVSSVNVYPPAELQDEANMWQGLPKQADRFAGIAKRVGEFQAEVYQQSCAWDGVKIVRPANVYGPYDDFNPESAQVIPALISRMSAAQDSIAVWGDGSTIRDFIFSEDLAHWLLVAMEKLPGNTPVNMGAGIGVSIKQLAETIRDQINPNLEIKWDTSKPMGDAKRLLNISKAKDLINYQPEIDLDNGIRKTIEWYQANQASSMQRREQIYG